jgi:RNA polymerase sigma factor (TIGR02999 family)
LREKREETVMPRQDGSRAAAPSADTSPKRERERKNLDQLFSASYEELRRLAATVKRGDPCATLTPTALVNEAWVKLAQSPDFMAESPLHFKRIAARAMRQLLVEAARRRNARKRGGNGQALFITLDESLDGSPKQEEDLLVLDAAMSELEQIDPRQATIVESRFFGGLEISEIAALLGISEATVLRDWRSAKAWLGQKIRPVV